MKFNELYNQLINENFILDNRPYVHYSYLLEPKLDNKIIDSLIDKSKSIYKQYLKPEDNFTKNKHICLSLIDGEHFKDVLHIMKHMKPQDIKNFDLYTHEHRPNINYNLKNCFLAARDNRKTLFIDIDNQEEVQNYVRKLRDYIKNYFRVNIPDYKDRYYYLNVANTSSPVNNININDKSLYKQLMNDTNRENLVRHLKPKPKIFR